MGITQSYVSIDLETTGLNPKTDKIMEIGAVKRIDGVCAGTFSAFVNPGKRLEPHIAELTGIREEDLQQAPYIEEVLPGLLAFLEELPLLGHRVLFDYSFLKKAAVNQKFTFEKQGIDTLQLSRKYLADLESRRLDYLCGYYRIPHKAHRALEDARAADLLYRKLAEQFFSEEESLFRPAQLTCKVKKDRPATERQKERLYRLAARHKIILDMEIDAMTYSEVCRYTDKILAGSRRFGEPPEKETM